MTSQPTVLTDPYEAVDKLLEVRFDLACARDGLAVMEGSTFPGTDVGDPVVVAITAVDTALERLLKLAEIREVQRALTASELAKLAKRERS